MIPDYLTIPATELGKGTPVKVRALGDMASIAQDFAATLRDEIVSAQTKRRPATFIVPVGPVDQFPVLARMLNEGGISCRDVVLINMDEYIGEDGRWIPQDHPLSFRGYMKRAFYDLLDPALAPTAANRVFPDPHDCDLIRQIIASRGGLDVCFGGIGINGHVAFNEPPEPGESISIEAFAELPTRVLPLSRETRTINSVTVGGEIAVIPHRAITVGMKEILSARKLRFYCNRPWQSAVVRRALHGPLTPACPASFFRTHPDALVTVAEYVAAPPQIMLR
jgi:glucosamine-6-phosphate deaminase